jgi:preprotein translocase subunit SecD
MKKFKVLCFFIILLLNQCSTKPRFSVQYSIQLVAKNGSDIVTSDMINKTKTKLEKRFNRIGATNTKMEIIEPDILNISLKVLQTPDEVKKVLLSNVSIKFCLVDEYMTYRINNFLNNELENQSSFFNETNEQILRNMIIDKFSSENINQSTLYIINNGDNQSTKEIVIVEDEVLMNGDAIEFAMASTDHFDSPSIVFTTTKEGKEKFRTVTYNNVGKRLAIIINNELITAPVINSAIPGGKLQITGIFTKEKTENLATSINLGSLPVNCVILNEKFETLY